MEVVVWMWREVDGKEGREEGRETGREGRYKHRKKREVLIDRGSTVMVGFSKWKRKCGK